ncbi:antitoxin Xre/MbcA/ParS toxin-binding domain-containing protein [Pseudomonas aeruginosa]
MNNFNEKRLASDYSILLFGRDSPEGKVFGFECLDGWTNLIEAALRFISRYSELMSITVRIVQVKEKFGLLRIYTTGGDEYVDLVADILELISGEVCERCGRCGRITSLEGWMQTRCNRHFGLSHCAGVEVRSVDNCYVKTLAGTLSLLMAYFQRESLHWAQLERRALGGQKPYQALATLEGAQAVYTLIKRLEYGVGV